MAQIVGGIATSHTPTIGFAFDTQKQNDPAWAPIFEGYEPVRQWLAERAPDVLLYVYNDHMTSFFLDHYPQFALGVGAEFPIADEGGGARRLPPFKGHPALAEHIAKGLVADDFDLSYFQNRALDHGAHSPLSLLLPFSPDWPVRLIPLQVGVLVSPTPTARRCYQLGRALRRAIRSFPEDIKVAIVGTGGLSHQVHGERCGFNNPDWDAEFMERLERDPKGLTGLTIAEYAELGGMEGAEVIMWLIMRAALSKRARCVHKFYYLPSMTGIASMIFEEQHGEKPDDERKLKAYRKRIDRQLAGIDRLEGTYPFTISRSVKAFRLNDFLHGLIDPVRRERFLSDPEASYSEAGLTPEEREMVRNLDWRAMLHYGVSFFMLEKLGAVVGTSNMHIYAAMRNESLEDLLKTRNANVLYSVAGDVGVGTSFNKKN
jgi:gallate dioxygenase